jgi:hypothetical protein
VFTLVFHIDGAHRSTPKFPYFHQHFPFSSFHHNVYTSDSTAPCGSRPPFTSAVTIPQLKYEHVWPRSSNNGPMFNPVKLVRRQYGLSKYIIDYWETEIDIGWWARQGLNNHMNCHTNLIIVKISILSLGPTHQYYPEIRTTNLPTQSRLVRFNRNWTSA